MELEAAMINHCFACDSFDGRFARRSKRRFQRFSDPVGGVLPIGDFRERKQESAGEGTSGASCDGQDLGIEELQLQQCSSELVVQHPLRIRPPEFRSARVVGPWGEDP